MKNKWKRILAGSTLLILAFLFYQYMKVEVPPIEASMIFEVEHPLGTPIQVDQAMTQEIVRVLEHTSCIRMSSAPVMDSANAVSLRIYAYEKDKTWPIQLYLLKKQPENSFFMYKGSIGKLPAPVTSKLLKILLND